jgi:hypothetical protein
VFNLNYTPTTSGAQVQEKLHLGVREQTRLNTTGFIVKKKTFLVSHQCGTNGIFVGHIILQLPNVKKKKSSTLQKLNSFVTFEFLKDFT